jgi:formate dehydrogenase major subunit
MYNRASADPDGNPWSERKRYVWWDASQQKWVGEDVPDFIVDRSPTYRPSQEASGIDTIAGDDPFIMQADGKGWLFAPTGLLDGPLPTHYEPHESVVENLLYEQQSNPARMQWKRRDNPYHRAFGDKRFPYAITTYRLTEHHTITTARAEIEARVLVSRRIPPLKIKGRTIYQIGLPYHWGSKGLSKGDTVNELISFVADPNTSIQESKALTGNIEAGRRSKMRRAATSGPLD